MENNITARLCFFLHIIRLGLLVKFIGLVSMLINRGLFQKLLYLRITTQFHTNHKKFFERDFTKDEKIGGGVGFGWWQYQEVDWRVFEHDLQLCKPGRKNICK